MKAISKSIDPAATKQDRVIEHERQLVCCRYSHDGNSLFAAGLDGHIHRFDLKDGRHDSWERPGGWIESMELHPNGGELFTASSWGQVDCWSIDNGQLKSRWTIKTAHSTWLRGLALSSNAKTFATCGNDHVVRVFATSDGRQITELKGHTHHVQSVAFHQDENTLVSGDLHGVVKHWSISDGKCVRDLDASQLYKNLREYNQGGVRCMTFDSEFKTLYCAGFEGQTPNQAHGKPTVVALDFASGKQQLVMNPTAAFQGPVLSIQYHPAGFVIGAGSSEGGGALWFWKPGEEKDSFTLKNPTSFRGIDLSPDGMKLAATAFGDRGGQRGGNGRKLTKDGEYVGFAGNIVLYNFHEPVA